MHIIYNIIDKLKDNNFIVKYTHPNLIFISWKHWVPSDVRQEIKKKTGLVVDGYDNQIVKNEDDKGSNNNNNNNAPEDLNELFFHKNNKISIEPTNNNNNNNTKDYKSINTYKPTGNLIYNHELLKNIERYEQKEKAKQSKSKVLGQKPVKGNKRNKKVGVYNS